MLLGRIVEGVVRTDGRRVLAGLIRLTGDFDAAEDALQEAYARALVVWHRDGVPATPGAWLNTVARRIAIDRLRRDRHTALPDDVEAPPVEFEEPHAIEDDRLRLLFTCCHPALAPEAQCALALRTLGGLTTREIARGVRRAGVHHGAAARPRQAQDPRGGHSLRGAAARQAARAHRHGARRALPDLQRGLRGHRRRLAAAARPDGGGDPAGAAVDGTAARRRRGAGAAGADAADRRAARRAHHARTAISSRSKTRTARCGTARRSTRASGCWTTRWRCGAPGPYQTQAAIAALHSTAATAAETDWPQIAALYQALLPPDADTGRRAQRRGGRWAWPTAGRTRWRASRASRRAAIWRAITCCRPPRRTCLRRLGRPAEAADAYRAALALVTNAAERRYPGKAPGGVRRPELHSLIHRQLCAGWRLPITGPGGTHVRFAHRQAAGDEPPSPSPAGERLIGSLFLADQADTTRGRNACWTS